MSDQVCILSAIKLLASNFNKKFTEAETKEKVSLFYNFLKDYNNREINNAVTQLISEGQVKYFPDVSDLRRYLSINKESVSVEYCNTCEHTGYYNIWQLKQDIGKYYSIAYACTCNNTKHGMTVIDPQAIPIRAHNPYPPTDNRHDQYNRRIKNG